MNAIDPSGLLAIVCADGNSVSIDVPIHFFGAGVSDEVVQRFVSEIQQTWTGTFGPYDVTTTVTLTDGSAPSTTNMIEIVNITAPLFRSYVDAVGGQSGRWAFDTNGAAHEVGHLMGLGEGYQRNTRTGFDEPLPGVDPMNIMAHPFGRPSADDIRRIIEFNPSDCGCE